MQALESGNALVLPLFYERAHYPMNVRGNDFGQSGNQIVLKTGFCLDQFLGAAEVVAEAATREIEERHPPSLWWSEHQTILSTYCVQRQHQSLAESFLPSQYISQHTTHI